MKALKTLKNKWISLAFTCALSVACLGAGVATLNAKAEGEIAKEPLLTYGGASFQYAGKDVDGKDNTKMRIAVEMSKDTYDTTDLEEKEMHILVLPTDMLSGDLTNATAYAEDKVLGEWEIAEEDSDKYRAYATLYNFPSTWYNRSFSWCAYYNDGTQDVYSDTWSQCLANVAKTVYTDETDESVKAQIKPYCTYTASYDLGIRVEGSTTQWQVEEGEVLYGDATEAPNVPARPGFEFLEWKYTEGSASDTVVGNVKAEAIWLLTSSINPKTAADLYAVADLVSYKTDGVGDKVDLQWGVTDGENGSVILTRIEEGTGSLDIQFKNIVVPKEINYAFAGTTSGSGYKSFNAIKNDGTNLFIVGKTAAAFDVSNSINYANNQFTTYDADKGLYYLTNFRLYENKHIVDETMTFTTFTLAIPEEEPPVEEPPVVQVLANGKEGPNAYEFYDITSATPTEKTVTVNTDDKGDYVEFIQKGYSAGSKLLLKFTFENITLNKDDKIHFKAYYNSVTTTQTRAISIRVNGTQPSGGYFEYDGYTGNWPGLSENKDGFVDDDVYTATAETALSEITLQMDKATNGCTLRIYALYIERAAQ